MGRLADFLFRISYLPLRNHSVKQDCLGWYYEAVQHHRVSENLDLDNSELAEMALDAATKAENYDKNAPAVEMFDFIDDILYKAKLVFYAILLIAVLAGFSAVVGGLLWIHGLMGNILSSVGGLFAVSGLVVAAVFHLTSYYIRSSAQVVAKFNRRLTEKPGQVRSADQDWDRLAAKYVWNRSLCKPRTISMVLLLSTIQLLSTNIYGLIAGDLRHNIRDFVGKGRYEIFRYQINRLKKEFSSQDNL